MLYETGSMDGVSIILKYEIRHVFKDVTLKGEISGNYQM